ncbi:hypothetical protein P3785_31820, partial [Pseudomonas aeruginosa]|nr:hypothetical protein [Pseudomonas aeruginosa]
QEQLFAGLLALAGVLGIGEGHLLHRKTQRVASRYFAKNWKSFSEFPKRTIAVAAQGPWLSPAIHGKARVAMAHKADPQTMPLEKEKMRFACVRSFPFGPGWQPV